jgi:hypothetical protein
MEFDLNWLAISTGFSKFVIVPLYTSLKESGIWNLAGMELQMSGCGKQVAAISECVMLY